MGRSCGNSISLFIYLLMSSMYLMLTDQFATASPTKNMSRITARVSADGDAV
jgi:hypothetical protein